MFKKKKKEPSRTKLNYPKWSYVYNIDNDKYYLILTRFKKEFISERAFRSWRMSAVRGTNESLSFYSNYGKVGFRPGTVVRSMSHEFYYIAEENKRHLITTPDFFSVLGFSSDVYYISNKELLFHEEGEEISGIYL